MDIFYPAKHGSKTKRQRGKVVIRCTGKHADLIEARLKKFMLRFDDPQPQSFEAGKLLTIIRYEGRFQNQRTIAKNEVLITGVIPFHLDRSGMRIGNKDAGTYRELSSRELEDIAATDGFTCWERMATHYLSRRTAYHSAYPWRQRKEFEGIMVTWDWRPDLAHEVFRTSGRPKKKRVPRKEYVRRQKELAMIA